MISLRGLRWGRATRLSRGVALLVLGGLCAGAVVPGLQATGSEPNRQLATRSPAYQAMAGIHKIRHVVIIMQENRSFDSYFGTYPRAKGIPGLAGHPGHVPCVPDPGERCVRPFHELYDRNLGGPNFLSDANKDIDHGRMDGFIAQEEPWLRACGCRPPGPVDSTMGYHTGAEIPNYWTYARDFVLQDHMFAAVPSWSLPSHLFLVSAWSAHCKTHNKPGSCRNAPQNPGDPPGWPPGQHQPRPVYAWTDLTYLLSKHHVSWRYYYFNGTEPACEADLTLPCTPTTNGPTSLTIWNPLKYFDTVHQDAQAANIQSLRYFFSAAQAGKLPAVSWIVPSASVSEHPPALVSAGQTYVTGLIDTIMRSPDWNSTAIFLTWDDWAGFYDSAVPPAVDRNGYGLRVPGLVISPYAKRGYIDRQTLSFDAYLKFIEDDFLGGQRLNPKTDGRPDPRPTVREAVAQLGNLIQDFNFRQRPRPPVILPVHPKTDLLPSIAGPFYGWGSPALTWG